MARFFGKVGYVSIDNTAPGIYEEVSVVKNYYGNVLRNTRRYESGEHLNDNLTVNNMISILADAYAFDHFFAMRWIEWMGIRWKITNIEVQRPRLILTIGGVYNGQEDGPSVDTGDTP